LRESILHYIWQHQYFDTRALKCTDGQELSIINKGRKNTNEGPDFEQSRVKIGNIEWAGSVEIHLKSSDWNVHNHANHRGYDNVILHVVYEQDVEILARDGVAIHTLEFKNRISNELIRKCTDLLENTLKIPCEAQINKVDSLTLTSTLDRMAVSRLQRKAETVLQMLNENHGDWEETTYQVLVQNFGFKVNSAAFLRLAQNLPLKVLLKQAGELSQIEALLFGQAGLLDEESLDEYYWSLKKEYQFLSHKYSLSDKKLQSHEWKFLRMRPANFPTIRISQLANLIYMSKGFFSHIIEVEDLNGLKKIFQVSQSSYWQNHYLFGKLSGKKIHGTGEQTKETLIINTVCVILAAYSKYKNDEMYMERALRLLEQLPSENNAIIDLWDGLGIKTKTAFDSQALLELYNNNCMLKKCLECQVGHRILNFKF
jgi:hypothetical protein